MKLGLSGLLTRAFINSPLTPLLLLAAIVAGALALASLPREEEPQISVPMVDIILQANGYKADQAVELVTRPLEDIIKGIDGVEHVYSQTGDDLVVVTARFLVGTDQDSAITRVHEKIRAHIGELPKGIPEPLIIGRGINDVAIVDLTLSARPDHASQWSDNALFQVAEELQHELTKVDNVGSTYIVGGSRNQIRVEPDPERLAVYGVTLSQLIDKLTNANRSFLVGAFRDGGKSLPVLAGQTLQGVPDIGLLLLTTRDGRPVYVKDVADVTVGAAEPEHRAWTMTRLADGELQRRPAVTIAVAKRKGSNAVVVAEDVMRQLDVVKGRVIPADLEVSVTRNYGATASEKANELLFHLALATVSIVVLITIAVGWREGLVVLIVIPTTILLTLFASWLMGYTINRVSLFALIFSIGILVDDAIVIVENIARHWAMNDGRNRTDAAIAAVAEVGNPTIVATLTIIAALLPMMFVSGLMGPYMSPIPANASIAMLFSFFIAVTVTPWLLLRFARSKTAAATHGVHGVGAMGRFYAAIARPLLKGRVRSKVFLITVGAATLAACTLFYTEAVRVKLLPFDNKSEIQVVLDLPHGATARGHRPHADVCGRAAQDAARAGLDPGLFGDGLAIQLQRPRPPLLSARESGAGRSLDQPFAERGALAREPRDRARHPPPARGSAATRRLGAQGRRGSARARRCWRRCWPRSMGRTLRRGAPRRRRFARPSSRSISSSTSMTATANRQTGYASRSTRRRSSSTASRSRRSMIRSARSSAA